MVLATREGAQLPDFDALLIGSSDVVDRGSFVEEFSATLKKLGKDRVAKIFTRDPGVANLVG